MTQTIHLFFEDVFKSTLERNSSILSEKERPIFPQILTPNQRLARYLIKEFAAYQKSKHIFVYEPITILPITAWLEKKIFLMQEQTKEPFFLLNDPQTNLIWQEIIGKDARSNLLLNLPATAKMALNAWQTCHLWQVSRKRLQSHMDSIECSTFLEWQNVFSKYCIERNLMERTQAYTQLAHYLENIAGEKEKLVFDAPFFLFGFNDISPLFNFFLKSAPSYQPDSVNESSVQTSFDTAEEEIWTIAQFAKETWKLDPKSKIACVFPTLHEIRDSVQKIFTDVFASEEQEISSPHREPKERVNISGGASLNTFPLVHFALKFLAWMAGPQSLDVITYILSAPFLGEAQKEFFPRKKWLLLLKEKGRKQATVQDLISILTEEKNSCPLLLEILQRIITFQKQFISEYYALSDTKITKKISLVKMSLEQWAKYFAQQLKCIAWPGERNVNSEEYQTYHRFQSLLEEFSQLAYVLPECTLFEALKKMEWLSQETLFQIQTCDAPIQVLGMLEAAGHPFTHVWLADCDEDALPASPKPNPFLPLYLQHTLNFPHASFERENQIALNLVTQLKESCKQFIISFHHTENDLIKNPSALLAGYDLWQETAKIIQKKFDWDPFQRYKKHAVSNQLELYCDTQVPEVKKEVEGTLLQGGSSLLKWQGDCPFQAFARSRLKIGTQRQTSLGLSALERGNLIHRILEILWKKWPQSKTINHYLHTKSEYFLNELHQIISGVIIEAQQKNPQYFLSEAHKKLEIEYLTELISEWLIVESARPEFEVIQTECETRWKAFGFEIKIRADRIDKIVAIHQNNFDPLSSQTFEQLAAQDKLLIVDYKTGKPKPISGWFDTPVSGPQLPLYTLSFSHIVGISFAQVSKGKCRYQGFSGPDLAIWANQPKIDFLSQQKKWNSELHELLKTFLTGPATLQPRKGESTCAKCDLPGLCRKSDRVSELT